MKQKITAVRTILLRGFACILSTVFGISFLLKSSFCINSFLLYIKCVSFIRRSKNSRTSRSDFLIPSPRIREITA